MPDKRRWRLEAEPGVVSVVVVVPRAAGSDARPVDRHEKREQRDEDDDATHNHKHVGPVVDGLEHCRPDYRANIAASADDPRRNANLGRTNEGHLTPGRTAGSAGD